MPPLPDDTTSGPIGSAPGLEAALRHRTWVRALAASLVGESSLADDVAQEAWVRVIASPPPGDATWRNWLAGVVRNVVRDTRRSNARRARREAEAAHSEADESSCELLERVEEEGVLVQLVLDLDEPYRSAILRRYFDGWSVARIAHECEAPEPTVRTRLRRGLGQLREALDKCYGGDRRAWMSAVTALAAPVGNGVGTGTLVIGGMAMGTMMKVSAGVLVAAACVYFVARTPPAESPRMAAVEPPAADVELVESIGAAVVSAVEDPATQAVRQRLVAEEPPARVSAARGTNVLRVVLEGITEEDARRTRFTLTGVDKRRDDWPPHISVSWPCQGLTSEFDLDPFFASVAGATNWNLHVDELEVKVVHPLHLIEKTRVPLSRGVELKSGQSIYEVRVRLVPGAPYVFWPELTLDVRDADTRAHLEDVELRCVPTSFMASQLPGGEIYTSLGGGLSSPIVLLGGREADGPEDRVVGLALGSAAGEARQLTELCQPEATDRGVLVYARAPGYAWSTIVLDVSTGAERELLLWPAAALNVWMANVQLERYAALEKEATLFVVRPRPRGEGDRVWSQRLDKTLETEGLRLENLEPGEYAVSVELGSWRQKRHVLAREELSLAAGESRELVLPLLDAPAPPERATLGGVVSFPAFGGEEEVRLQFYGVDYRYGDADIELSLADLKRVGGALPTWSFRLEDLTVGLYQVQLLPFLKNWMIELPAGGREDVELVVQELAEVLVESVDARTGERIPLEEIRYGYREDLQGKVHHEWSTNTADRPTAGFEGEPGRFRFWTAPGAAYISTVGIPSGLDYGDREQDLELVPGLQSVRFELAPVNAIRFEFRVGGALLPRDDAVYHWQLRKGIRAVDHEGFVTANFIQSDRLVEVSAPGVYEVSFNGVGAARYEVDGAGADRFHPIPPRRVYVRAGETAEVIVELRRK